MEYPAKCIICFRTLFGNVLFCPYCGQKNPFEAVVVAVQPSSPMQETAKPVEQSPPKVSAPPPEIKPTPVQEPVTDKPTEVLSPQTVEPMKQEPVKLATSAALNNIVERNQIEKEQIAREETERERLKKEESVCEQPERELLVQSVVEHQQKSNTEKTVLFFYFIAFATGILFSKMFYKYPLQLISIMENVKYIGGILSGVSVIFGLIVFSAPLIFGIDDKNRGRTYYVSTCAWYGLCLGYPITRLFFNIVQSYKIISEMIKW